MLCLPCCTNSFPQCRPIHMRRFICRVQPSQYQAQRDKLQHVQLHVRPPDSTTPLVLACSSPPNSSYSKLAIGVFGALSPTPSTSVTTSLANAYLRARGGVANPSISGLFSCPVVPISPMGLVVGSWAILYRGVPLPVISPPPPAGCFFCFSPPPPPPPPSAPYPTSPPSKPPLSPMLPTIPPPPPPPVPVVNPGVWRPRGYCMPADGFPTSHPPMTIKLRIIADNG